MYTCTACKPLPRVAFCSRMLPWAAASAALAKAAPRRVDKPLPTPQNECETMDSSTTHKQNTSHNVTLIPGDGIGPEVAQAACRIIDASGVAIHWEEVPATPPAGARWVISPSGKQ